MSGTPPMVADKRNLILVSGDRALFERMQPLLARAAAKVPYIGPLGTSLKLKLVNNMLGAVHLMAAAEALNLAGKAGIDLQAALEALGAGASSSAYLLERGPRMVRGDYAGSNGPLESFWKYLEMGPQLAAEVGAPTPMLNTALAYFKQAIDAGRGGDDTSVVFEMLRRQ
jgi:3-hydroxyisobutyrate dehydrogenase-like beta-hydroxyacid dehydrogenase